MISQQSMTLGWDFFLPVLVMIVLLLLAVRIWVVFGLGTLLILISTDVLPVTILSDGLFDGINSFALIAVPLFILTGDALVRSGLSGQLLDFAEATMGSFKTGLGTSTVLGCGLFACISGSDASDAAAIGRVTIHRLAAKGYPMPYACALVASGACTGVLIPPSISYIIIGLILGISASTLFKAAIIPGVLILVSVIVTNILINNHMKYEHTEGAFTFKNWLKSVYAARYALTVPLIILGGIYSGIFTPTESAAVASIYTLGIGFLQKRIQLKDIPKILETSARIAGIIVPIIAVALPLAQTLSALQIPQFVVQGMTGITENPYLIMGLMLALLMAAGCVMETTPNIVILAPILLPLAQSIGMNDLHFCIFMVTALGIGFITPPLGLNLFVVSGLYGTPVMSIAKYAIPFALMMLIVILLIMFVPWISLVFVT
jgi:tripartite ATP-independent transporter DctM subunit